MSETSKVVEKRISLSADHVDRLHRLAQAQQVSEDQIIERALDILFRLIEHSDAETEQEGWSFLSENALHRVWDNDADAAYDNWRELYGAAAR